MPNYVTNKIIALDKEALLKAVYNKEEQRIDFNMVVPMPEDLRIESGSFSYPLTSYKENDVYSQLNYKMLEFKTAALAYDKEKFRKIVLDDTEAVALMKEANQVSENYDEHLNFIGEGEPNQSEARTFEYILVYIDGFRNKQKYNFVDWYDWNRAKWGTKWNALETYVDEETGIISFDTAWSVPYPILYKLARITPLRVLFADEDSYCGMFDLIYNKETDEVDRYDVENSSEALFICVKRDVHDEDLEELISWHRGKTKQKLIEEIYQLQEALDEMMTVTGFKKDIIDNEYLLKL